MHLKSELIIKHVIAKRLQTAKNVLWVFSLIMKHCHANSCAKDTLLGNFYKNVVIKTLNIYHEINRPKTGMKYLRLLCDNASPHKTCINCGRIFGGRKVYVLRNHPFIPDLTPATIFWSQNSMGLQFISIYW